MKLRAISAKFAALWFTLLLMMTATLSHGHVPTVIPKETVVQKCTATNDESLIKTIKETFAADPTIKDQMRHLNVSSKNRVVKLEGWLDGKAAVATALTTVRKTPCVRRVLSSLKTHGGGSCGPGQKPCGDICIDRRSACTVSESQQ